MTLNLLQRSIKGLLSLSHTEYGISTKRTRNKYSEKTEKVECEICYKRVSNLRLHKRNKHSGDVDMYSCDMCDKSLKSAKLMAQHKAKQHKSNNFKCNSCNYSHASLQSVRRHILENHETDQIPFVTQLDSMVSFCSYFNNNYLLYSHVHMLDMFLKKRDFIDYRFMVG